MSFASNHSEIVKLNNYNLRDLGGTASFEVSAISGRGLPPTRERELQFPGEMGARDYGSYYGNRRIEVNGTLYADSINDFRAGLNKIKELCRLRTFVDGILYEQVEAQMLWFADESVVAGPYTLSAASKIGPASSIFDATDAIGNYPSAYSSDDDLIGFDLEFANRGATAAPTKYTINSDGNVVSTGRFFCSPYYDSASPPTIGDTFWIVDNRYYLVNYSGSMNEERLTAQWFKTGYSRLTLPFKAVYPFAVSDPKKVDFTPNSTNGYFKAINTGNAISYPVYKIKGAANTPQIVEATHSLVWNANDNTATNILGESVSATVSAAGFYGQPGKLNQAIAFDANQDRTKDDRVAIINTETRNGMGIGTALNLNQGTVSFWFKKAGDYGILYGGDSNAMMFTSPSCRIYRYCPDSTTNRLYLNIGNQYIYANVGTALTAGNWYFLCARWDVRRNDVSGSFYGYLDVADSSGSYILAASMGSNPTDPTVVGPICLSYDPDYERRSFDGLIDDLAIWDRPLTDTERNTLVNSGTGVRADTVASSELVYYSDFDQTVGTTFDATQIASSNVDTMQTAKTNLNVLSTVELPDDSDPNKIFFEDDRVVLYDETGYKVQGLVADAGTNYVDVDNGSGAVVTDIDKVGVYATFDGGDWFNAGNVCSNSGQDYSISLWVKNTETSHDRFLGKGSSANYEFTLHQDANGYLGFHMYSLPGVGYMSVASPTKYNDGKWHHIATVYTHATPKLELYVDGVLVATDTTAVGSIGAGAAGLVIGANWGGSAASGTCIRDVAIWDGTALTSGNVLSLATQPLNATSAVSQPTEWWKLTEADFSTSAASSGTGGTAATNTNAVTRTQLAYISKNLIADGGMENGGIGGWGAYASVSKELTTVKKDASAIWMENVGKDSDLIYQYLTAAAGEDYVIRYWYRTDGGASNQIRQYITGLGTYSNFLVGDGSGDYAFGEYCYEWQAGATGIGFRSATVGNFDFYFDDIKLLPNLVDNGGMEGAVVPAMPTGWGSYESGASTVEGSATEKHSGSQSIEIDSSVDGANCNASQTVTVVAGEYYEVSFWTKCTTSSGNQTLYLYLFSNSVGGDYSPYITTYSDWTRHSYIIRPGDTTLNMIFVRGSTNATTYVDDVAVVHRPDLSVSFNNMTNGYRFEPTRLTRGYKTGLNELYEFTPLVINKDEMSGRVVVRPQFPSASGEGDSHYVFMMYNAGVGNSYLRLYYHPSDAKFFWSGYNGSSWITASSPVMSFSQDEEIEIGFSMDGTYLKIYINGSNVGATNTSFPGLLANINHMYVGRYSTNYPHTPAYIIDDLEILAKSQPAEWFAEKYAKRNEARNLNLPFKYSSTLNAGDILTINALDPKVRGRVEMYYASSGETQNQMGVSNVAGSMMPILSPTKSMLYFPNSIPSGVEIYYRENHQ